MKADNVENLILDHFNFHVRNMGTTSDIEKTLKLSPEGLVYGTMYLPMKIEKISENKYKLNAEFPKELQEKIKSGEITLMMHKDGPQFFSGKDTVQKLAQIESSKRRQMIHRGQVWRKE